MTEETIELTIQAYTVHSERRTRDNYGQQGKMKISVLFRFSD